jgi:acyl dehydratase
MIEIQNIEDASSMVGQHLGFSDWHVVDQSAIDAYAEVSGDRNWIHVDVERARRELPEGKTIVHGLLTLSLVTHLGAQIFRVVNRGKGINYGCNKVRFINPVLCGARIRLSRTLVDYTAVEGGARLTFGNEMQIEGQSKPAMVAETISVIYR